LANREFTPWPTGSLAPANTIGIVLLGRGIADNAGENRRQPKPLSHRIAFFHRR
jgi:hypothetical protein